MNLFIVEKNRLFELAIKIYKKKVFLKKNNNQ